MIPLHARRSPSRPRPSHRPAPLPNPHPPPHARARSWDRRRCQRRVVVAVGGRIARGKALRGGLVALVVVGNIAAEHAPELLARLAQRDPILRALRTRDARHDVAEVELQRVRVGRPLRMLVVPQALLRARRPRPARSAPAAGPRTRGSAASPRRSGRSRRSSRTPATCSRSSPDRPAADRPARRRRTRRTSRPRRARAASA